MSISHRVRVTNRCDLEKVDACYRPLIDDLTSVCLELFGDKLLDLRLVGSVARGQSKALFSDIDLVALLAETVVENEREALEQNAVRLQKLLPQVREVEIVALSLSDLLPQQQLILRGDSVSLSGSQLYPEKSFEEDRAWVAELVDIRVGDVRDQQWGRIMQMNGKDLSEIECRLLSKQLLRCFRSPSILLGADYEISIPHIHRQLVKVLPAHEEFFNRLLNLFEHPTAEIGKLEWAMAESLALDFSLRNR